MILKKFSISILIFVVYVNYVNSARILGLFTSPSKSHIIVHMAVAKGLIEKGHNVTVLTTIELNEPNSKYRHFRLNGLQMSRGVIKTIINNRKSTMMMSQMLKMSTIRMDDANVSLNDPQMKKLMNEETFDLVLLGYFLNDFQLGVAAHFKCPSVVIWMVKPILPIHNFVGNPLEISYVPTLFSGLKQPLGFIDRVKNYMINVLEKSALWLHFLKMESYYTYNFPSDRYPSLSEVQSNVSLVLVNHHFSQGPVQPNVPGMIEIGGIQIKNNPDPLPEDLQKALDAATHGAIYFSLGSNIQSSELNSKVISTIYNVLSNLKQTVIWKWENDELPGNAKNIIFKKWLPQNDILAHPNIKLFISHGGYGSVTESLFHGVPIIGFPMFDDQFTNMEYITQSNFGLRLDHQILTAESFEESIKEILENPNYINSVKRFSDLYKDRPQSAMETAMYWIEYVIRHKGAPHIKSPVVNMNFIQLQSLDVITFIILLLYITMKIIKFVIKFAVQKNV